MPSFRVEFSRQQTISVYVEAASQDEAIATATSEVQRCGFLAYDPDYEDEFHLSDVTEEEGDDD